MLGEITGQRRLAGAGIAEEPEQLRLSGLEPPGDPLQCFILLGREFHQPERPDSQGKDKVDRHHHRYRC